MKKRNFFICLLFGFLMCFSLNFFMQSKNEAFAAETVKITFNTLEGNYIEPQNIAVGGTLSSLPDAEKRGSIFLYWTRTGGDGLPEIITNETTFSSSTELVANYLRKINKYNISKSGENFVVIGETTNSDETYELTRTETNMNNILELIRAEMFNASDSVTLNFDSSVTIVEDLNLSFQNLTITGSLNLDSNSVICTFPVTASTFNLSNLTLNSNSNQDLVKIAGSNYGTINVSNTNFDSLVSDNNYAINFERPIHSVFFKDNLSYSTEFLYNFDINLSSELQKTAVFNESFNLIESPNDSISSQAKINITAPYYTDGYVVLRSDNTSVNTADQFVLFPTMTNYKASASKTLNGAKQLIATTTINFNFDKNFNESEGEELTPFERTDVRFSTSTNYLFPTEENFKKTHFSLVGFVAKLSYNQETWYFDKTMLENFINDGADLSKIPTHFSKSIPATNQTFTYYKKSNIDLSFSATDLMLSLGETPEFVAVWQDTVYTITLNENGGSEVANPTGIFGSSITLASPTKAGFEFTGWFTDEACKNLASLETMPDTNPTLYAGWAVKSFTLTINYNNETPSANKQVEFGTFLEDLEELNSENISKTGYTFLGWFTDDDQELALETMPANNLSVHAKWQVNQYTITLYLNHRTDNSVFKFLTKNYNEDASSVFETDPAGFEGYTFLGWFTDASGRFPFDYKNFSAMPAENINLYASWSQNEYKLTVYYPAFGESETKTKFLHFGDDLAVNIPSYAGFRFDGWFTDDRFETALESTTMPSQDLSIYAKLTEKQTLNLDLLSQTYTEDKNNGFIFSSKVSGFTLEYFVDDNWTTEAPTKKGSYNIRLSRAEDSNYKAYSKIFENALVITPNDLDLTLYFVILYALAGIEILCAIILLFITKQRKTYLSYAVALPFGIISTSQFVNFIVSLALAVFGFVLIIIQVVKLRKINLEITKIIIDNEAKAPKDLSENASVSKNVEILLQKEGFISASDYEEENEFFDEEELSLEKPKEKENPDSDDDDDDYLSFGSRK